MNVLANITEIIPHREPFIMVDHLIKADQSGFETEFTANQENIFAENGLLQEPALIENIAQSAAAGFGYLAQKNAQDEEPKLGFIGAIGKLKLLSKPNIGEKIRTQVDIITQFENVILIKGENFNQNGDLLVTCEMKMVIQE